MASEIDATYLRVAIKNILAGATTLKDSDNSPVFGDAQEYLRPLPTNPTWIAADISGLSFTSTPDGFPAEIQIWSIPFWLGVGAARQGFTGTQTARIWELIPLWVNFMKAHPLTQFSNAPTAPASISPQGVTVPDQAFVLQSEDTDTNIFLSVPVTINIEFRVEIERIKYQDGIEVIIT